jgi:hypothetical protein
MGDDGILCEVYVDTYSDVSNDHETEILDGDSDVPTTSSHKHSRPCYLDFTSAQATSTEGEESKLDSYDDKTSQEAQGAGRLFKIWPVYEYCLQKFRSVYSPKKELSLDEAMTLWWGCLKFWRHKPWKVTKYEVLVRMVRVTVSDYTRIYDMEIYAAKWKKLQETVLSLSDRI